MTGLKKLFTHKLTVSLLLIFVFALLIRFYQLDSNPVAISHDELDYVLNGKAIALSGSDLTQQWKPWSLTPIKTETLTAELYPVLQTIPFSFLSLNLFNARLLSVILSAATVLVLGLLVYELTSNKKLSLLTAAVFSLNPWSILLSHTAYEAPNSLFFYLLAIYFLLRISSQNSLKKSLWLALITAVSFTIGFYTYHGYKLMFPFLVVLPLAWQWFTAKPQIKKQLRLPYLIIIVLIGGVTLKFLSSLNSYGQRQSELLILNSQIVTDLVNSSRRLGFASSFSNIFINKYTFLLREIILRYLSAFNPANLFVTGRDASVLFSLFQTGYLYLIELPLVIVGAWFLHGKYRKAFYLLLALLLISPLPAAMHIGNSIALRAGLLFPLLSIFIGCGWYVLFQRKKVSLKLSAIRLTALVLLITNFFYFWHIFQNNYPLYSADNYFFQERLLSEYVKRLEREETPATVLTSSSYHSFRAHLFYQNKLSRDVLQNFALALQNIVDENYALDSASWTTDCAVLEQPHEAAGNLAGQVLIVEEKIFHKCQKQQDRKILESANLIESFKQPEIIASPIDSRSYYLVFNSNLCSEFSLPKYVYNNDRHSFDLSNLSNQEFCEKWIIRQTETNK